VLDGDGEERWRARIPEKPVIEIEISLATQIPTRRRMLQLLGGEHSVGMRTGYLRMSLAPVGDGAAGGRLTTEVESYDGKQPSAAADGDTATIELEIDDESCGPAITAVATTPEFVIAGSGDGTLYLYCRSGDLECRFEVGRDPVAIAMAEGGRYYWTNSGGRITGFDQDRIIAAVQLPENYVEMAAWDTYLLAWTWEDCWLITDGGEVEWRAECVRPIRSVVVDDLGFWILAGQLHRLSRLPIRHHQQV
jgi:hypothetical protein